MTIENSTPEVGNQAHEGPQSKQEQLNAKSTTSAGSKGVKKSAYNARKFGIYSNALMPWESEEDVKSTCEELYKEYDIQDYSGELLVRQYVQVLLGIARLERGQATKVAKAMFNRSCRKEFADQVGISPLYHDKLPDWWFELDPKRCLRAKEIAKGVSQAKLLKENHSPGLMLQVNNRFPQLVALSLGLGWQNQVHTYGEWIGTRYKNASPVMNLQQLIDEFVMNFQFDLWWAENEDRYSAVIQCVMAQAELNVRSDPNLQRADVMLHKKAADLSAQLIEYRRQRMHSPELLVVSQVTPKVPRLK